MPPDRLDPPLPRPPPLGDAAEQRWDDSCFWQESLDRLKDYLLDLQRKETQRDRSS